MPVTAYEFKFPKGQTIYFGGKDQDLETFVDHFAKCKGGFKREGWRTVGGNRVVVVRCTSDLDVISFRLAFSDVTQFYRQVR